MRSDPELTGTLPVLGSLRGHFSERAIRNYSTGKDFLPDPGEILLGHPDGRLWAILQAIKMSRREGTRIPIRTLPKRRKIDAQQLANAALGIDDLTVHFIGRKIHKLRRNIGDQRSLRLSLAPFGPVHQQSDNQKGLEEAEQDGADDLPPVLLPEARLTKSDDAADRQASLAA